MELYLIEIVGLMVVLLYIASVRLILKFEWSRFDYFQVTVLGGFPEAVLLLNLRIAFDNTTILLIFATWIVWGMLIYFKSRIYKEKFNAAATLIFIVWFLVCFAITIFYVFRLAFYSYCLTSAIAFVMLYSRKAIAAGKKSNYDKVAFFGFLFTFILYFFSFFFFPYFYNG